MIRSWASGRVLGVGAAFAAAIGVGFLLPQTASAATTCTAPPGAPAEVVQIDGDEACGASTDGTAEAWSYGERGVGFADARSAAQVVAAGFDGGVGAGESTSGRLFAIGVGAQALALGVLESPGTAVVAAGPQSQAYVRRRRSGVVRGHRGGRVRTRGRTRVRRAGRLPVLHSWRADAAVAPAVDSARLAGERRQTDCT